MNSQDTPGPKERSYTLAEVAQLMIEGGRSCTIAELRSACQVGSLKSSKKRGIQIVAHSDFLAYINGPIHVEPKVDVVESKELLAGQKVENEVQGDDVKLVVEVDESAQVKLKKPHSINPVSGSTESKLTGEVPQLEEKERFVEGKFGDDLRYRCEVEYLADGTQRRHGRFQCWFANNQQASEGHYVHGQLEGDWRQWHENGNLKSEGQYRAGLQSGLWTTWDEAGSKLQEGRFESGQAQGAWTEYHGNGVVWRSCNFESGQISGHQQYYDPKGQPLGDEYGIQDGGL